MNKNAYSLILSNDVVRAVDKSAWEQGTSRSNLINRILAAHLGITTAEHLIGELFTDVQKIIETQPNLKVQPFSGNIMTSRGSLCCKYNPAIYYQVEINAKEGAYDGELRVSSRTTSTGVVQKLRRFFQLWTRIEQSDLYPVALPQVEVYNGRYFRHLRLSNAKNSHDSAVMGEQIGHYLLLLDASLQLFFERELDTADAWLMLNKQHQNYLQAYATYI